MGNNIYRYPKHKRHHRRLLVIPIILMLGIGGIWLSRSHSAPTSSAPTSVEEPVPAQQPAPPQPVPQAIPEPIPAYPIHNNIVATMFYVGEGSSSENGHIHNRASVWDEDWQAHYGGVDTPTARNGWLPKGFTPKENPFYIALPYNDLDDEGAQKLSARSVYWHAAASGHSLLKNTWVEVCYRGKCAYGQWQDAGPYGEDDVHYVFGGAPPANHRDVQAGIDVSPALNDYLGLGGEARVAWRFIQTDHIPAGPWQQIVTTSR